MSQFEQIPNVSEGGADPVPEPRESASDRVKRSWLTRKANEEKRRQEALAKTEPDPPPVLPVQEPVKEHPDPGPVPREPGMSDQLHDMLHVYTRPARTDSTPGQEACRKWFQESTSAFMAAKSKLEEAWALTRGPVVEAGDYRPEEDEGTAKAMAEADRILADIDERLGRKV